MRVALINTNMCYPVLVPNIAYILTSIKESGHEAHLVDHYFKNEEPVSYIMRSIHRLRPDIVAFSSIEATFPFSIKIADMVKKKYPGIKTVWGGVFPTLSPESVIRQSEVDVIFRGDAVKEIADYLDAVKAGKSLSEIEGIWYKENGTIIRNRMPTGRQDIDYFPYPDWGFYDMKKYLKVQFYINGSMFQIASMGCPYECGFCSEPALHKVAGGKVLRLRSPEKVIREIEMNYRKYYRLGFRVVNFLDRVFGLDREHFLEFSRLYTKSIVHKKIAWTCETRADVITEDWAKNAAKSGCCMIWMGLESGNEKIRMNILNKNIKDKAFENACRILKKNNILYRFFYILDSPGETIGSIVKGLRYARSLKPLDIHTAYLLPTVKTGLYQRLKEKNLLDYGKSKVYHTPVIRQSTGFRLALRLLRTQIVAKEVFEEIFLGLRLRGIKYICDSIAYIINFRGNRRLRHLPLPVLKFNLYQNTIMQYLFEDWSKGFCKQSDLNSPRSYWYG